MAKNHARIRGREILAPPSLFPTRPETPLRASPPNGLALNAGCDRGANQNPYASATHSEITMCRYEPPAVFLHKHHRGNDLPNIGCILSQDG